MHNPWIPIADLLSGFVVVTLLLFAVAAVQPRLERELEAIEAAAEAARLAEMTEEEPAEVRALRRRAEVFARLQQTVATEEAAGILSLDVAGRMLSLHDVSFQSGSACLNDEAQTALLKIAPLIVEQMQTEPDLEIQIQGHTDPVAVRRVTSRCGVFADNVQLSALRAANARALVLSTDPDHVRTLRGRMPVTGYGPDRLRNVVEETAPENRRVELRWIWSSSIDADDSE